MVGFGSITAHVFGPRGDLPRSLFWVLHLTREVRPGASEAEEAIQAVNCDWVTFPIRDWRQLDGLSAADFVRPDLIECSFYLGGEHFLAVLRSLSIKTAGPRSEFHVSLDMEVPSDDDLDPLPPLHVEAVVRFEGFIVVPENVDPPIENEAEATALLAGFADLALLANPTWDRFRFVFEPIDDGRSVARSD